MCWFCFFASSFCATPFYIKKRKWLSEMQIISLFLSCVFVFWSLSLYIVNIHQSLESTAFDVLLRRYRLFFNVVLVSVRPDKHLCLISFPYFSFFPFISWTLVTAPIPSDLESVQKILNTMTIYNWLNSYWITGIQQE